MGSRWAGVILGKLVRRDTNVVRCRIPYHARRLTYRGSVRAVVTGDGTIRQTSPAVARSVDRIRSPRKATNFKVIEGRTRDAARRYALIRSIGLRDLMGSRWTRVVRSELVGRDTNVIRCRIAYHARRLTDGVSIRAIVASVGTVFQTRPAVARSVNRVRSPIVGTRCKVG